MTTKTKTKAPTPRGPACGHSRCSQNYIDTGETACVNLCAACGAFFGETVVESSSRPEFCAHCVSAGWAEYLYPTE